MKKSREKQNIWRNFWSFDVSFSWCVFLNIFCFFLRLQLYHKTHHNTLFFKGFNDFIICPDSSFFIEKNFIQKSIHVFKKHPNRLGYGLCCYFHFKTSGNLELGYFYYRIDFDTEKYDELGILDSLAIDLLPKAGYSYADRLINDEYIPELDPKIIAEVEAYKSSEL